MGYGSTIQMDVPFERAIDQVKEAFKEEGFGTLTEIDVAATLKEKLDRTIEPYTILGVCNPELASTALDVDKSIGLLLPCNVVVSERGGMTTVEAIDPQMMVAVSDEPALRSVADEAAAGIGRAMKALSA